jgi:hypothetical protein
MTDARVAPTRNIGITTTQAQNALLYTIQPCIVIDGVAQSAQWGIGRWDVPRDKPVTITVWAQRGSMQYGLATYVLAPDGPSEIQYKAPSILDRPGSIGPRGSVTHAGNNILVPIYIIGGIAILATVVIGAVVVLFAFI